MKKCDIIIPVYKSPEWVKLCVYAAIKNTKEDVLNKIYLVNDCDDELTINCLKNLKEKYKEKIVLLQNEKNLGFVGTTNRGMKESKADYVLLLNTDCILSENAIEKMINNIQSDPMIGLVCPISSNAANLTLEMFPGFNFSDMNKLLERKFKGQLFDACTVVGNCLLITRDCINKTGYLDTAYGMGYGEETDYQFAAMSKGFKAKVSIDTYVYHKSEASFGTSKEKQERLNKNRDLFFSRWGEEYNSEYAKYEQNDPIKYIMNNLTEEDKKTTVDVAFYLNGIVQNAGGVHIVVDIVNYLAILGKNVNIVYDVMSNYKEIMLFNPLCSNNIEDVKINKIVATVWSSAFLAKKIADKKKSKLMYFVQGYEEYFENGAIYGIVETSYRLADSILTISNYLKDELKNTHNIDSTLIQNGVNFDLIHKKRTGSKVKSISIVMRNGVMKGDWILYDIIKKLDNEVKNIDINVIYMNEYAEFPQLKNNNLIKHLGPLSRNEITQILQQTDIYIDASLNEGFGLMPLEAIAAGNVVVVSNSMGNADYMEDGKNGFIIKEVNNSNAYVQKIVELVSNNKLYSEMRKNLLETSTKFDYDKMVDQYVEYFCNQKVQKNTAKLSDYDKLIYEVRTRENVAVQVQKRKVYTAARFVPKSIKRRLKRIITFLYNCYDH